MNQGGYLEWISANVLHWNGPSILASASLVDIWNELSSPVLDINGCPLARLPGATNNFSRAGKFSIVVARSGNMQRTSPATPLEFTAYFGCKHVQN